MCMCVSTFSITGRSSSVSMGILVLVTQVLVHRCRSLTYEFLQTNGTLFTANMIFTCLSLTLSFYVQRMLLHINYKYTFSFLHHHEIKYLKNMKFSDVRSGKAGEALFSKLKDDYNQTNVIIF